MRHSTDRALKHPLCPACGHPVIECGGTCMTPEQAARDYEIRMRYTILQVTTHDGQSVRVMKRAQSARRQARAVRSAKRAALQNAGYNVCYCT